MEFLDAELGKFLPLYHDPESREKIKSSLTGFLGRKYNEFEYPGFYTSDSPDYLLQSDLLNSVRTIEWSHEENDFFPIYKNGMLISNTCDIAEENERTYNEKQALIAPIMDLKFYTDELQDAGYTDQEVEEVHTALKNQTLSNIFYLPPNFINGKEYLVWLDKISWVPAKHLHGGYETIIENRFLSLTNWAFYLFLFKITYHFARLGNDDAGRPN